MSSFQGLRSEPSTTSIITTTTTTTTTTAAIATTTSTINSNSHSHTNVPLSHKCSSPESSIPHQHFELLPTAEIVITSSSPSPRYRHPPLPIQPRVVDDSDSSEVETVVIEGSDDETREKKELPEENRGKRENKSREREVRGKERRARDRGGQRQDEEEEEEDEGEEEEEDRGPRKRRRRSLSKSVVKGSVNNETGGGIDDEDADCSSDLSSARSSRQVSPTRRKQPVRALLKIEQPDESSELRPQRAHSYPHASTTAPNNAKKRKAPTNNDHSTDDDYYDEAGEDEERYEQPEPRLRRRRNSAFDSSSSYSPHHTRKQSSIRSSPPPLPADSRLSPTRLSKTKAPSTTSKKTRKLPPAPLTTARHPHSDDDSSSSASRRDSPPPRGHRRLHSAASRTPGSPISMSHKPRRDTAGRTHLHRACGRGAVADVEAILEQSTDLINSEDNAGYMPIHEASLNGHLDVVKLLIKYGALYDVQSKIDFESPLLDAVENGHVPVVKFLLELGADPRKRDRQGRSCLDAARENDEIPEVRDEIEGLLKAAIKQRPAHRTSDDENRASVPADRDSPSSRDHSVASPAQHSPPAPAQSTRRRNARAEQSRKDLLWLDSGKGSVIKLREKAREGDSQMVHALLETGLKPDTEALVGAIKGGHAELVSLLLAYQAEVDPVPGQTEREGGRKKREVSMPVGQETPMLAAIGRGNITILRYLLENGADPLRKDSKGRLYHEIARDREGEYWQEEVALLKEAWQKAGGHYATETRSPRRKSSPKIKPTPTKHLRRNSTSSSTRSQSRPPRSTDETRSTSANPSHHVNDLPAISDRESAEPPGPPKTRVRPKRSESESLTPAAAKKRRRLVSGKVRDEEAARAADPMKPERDSDRDNTKKATDKAKPAKNEMEDTIRVEQPTKKPKLEPSEDVTMADAPPYKPSKSSKPARERQPSTARSEASVKASKRPASRTRSPPRAPKADLEKRQQGENSGKRRRDDHQDDRDRERRRDSIAEDQRRIVREDRPRPPSVSSETSSRRRDDSRKPNRDGVDKRSTEDERRQRIRDREREKEKEKGEQESKDKKPREERLAKEKRMREKELDVTGISQEQIKSEAMEVIRKKHLTKELASMQRKGLKESEEHRFNAIVIRGLEERRLREEEEKRQRLVREREEKEQEERELREKEERELREKQAKEQEEREREVKEKQERERAEKEALEREQERERIAREKDERERREKEERERREKEEQELRDRELRLEEERKRVAERQLEEERRRKEEAKLEQERQSKLAAEAEALRKKEEAEKQRALEEFLREEQRQAEEADRKRKAEAEETKRRAEELQHQIAQEQEVRRRMEEEAKERTRIDSLPHTLRLLALGQLSGCPDEIFCRFIPFFATTFPAEHQASGSKTPNGAPHRQEKWVYNIQVALALGISDLTLAALPLTERRPATKHEHYRMWNMLNPMLMESIRPGEKTLFEQAASRFDQKEKYLQLQPGFWIKFDDIQSIVSSDPRYRHLRESIDTIAVGMNCPSPGWEPPNPAHIANREEMVARIKKDFFEQSQAFKTVMPPPPTSTSASASSG